MRSGSEWDQGQWGEDEVRRYLQGERFYVLSPSCIERGGAPAAEGELRRIIAADLQASRDGQTNWWEVKAKTRPAFYQKTGTHRHGIGEWHWGQYLQLIDQTGMPGWLAIVQREPPRLLAAPFSRLRGCVAYMAGSTDAYRGERMVYWDVDDFDVLVRGDQWRNPPPPRIDEPRAVHPWGSPPVPEEQQLRLEFG